MAYQRPCSAAAFPAVDAQKCLIACASPAGARVVQAAARARNAGLRARGDRVGEARTRRASPKSEERDLAGTADAPFRRKHEPSPRASEESARTIRPCPKATSLRAVDFDRPDAAASWPPSSTVTCRIIRTTGAVFCIWGTPEPGDVTRVIDELEKAVEAFGEPVVYITRVPENAPAPDAAVRKELDRVMTRITQLCSSYHVGMEGSGFIAAMKRGVLTSLLQPIWRRRMFYVHPTCGDALEVLEGAQRAHASELLAAARRMGLLTRSLEDHAPGISQTS